jgi:predicted transcriptional regulator
MTREPMTALAVRAPDALRRALQAIADENGQYLSEVIRAALESYVQAESTKKEES